MEMEMSVEMNETVERLAAAAGMLEEAVSRLSGIQVQAAEEATHVLEQKLAAAEARIAELSARAGVIASRIWAEDAAGQGGWFRLRGLRVGSMRRLGA